MSPPILRPFVEWATASMTASESTRDDKIKEPYDLCSNTI